MKLQTKFLSVLIPLVMVPLILAALLVHRHVSNLTQDTAQRQLNLLGDQVRQSLAFSEQHAHDQLNLLLSSSDFTEALNDPVQLQYVLERFRRAHSSVVQIDLLNAQGQRVAASSAQTPQLPLFTGPSNATITNDESRVIRPAEQPAPLLQLRLPIQNNASPADVLFGVISVRMDLLTGFLDNARRNAHVILFLADADMRWLSGARDFIAEHFARHAADEYDTGNEHIVEVNNQPYLVTRQNLNAELKLVGFTPGGALQRGNEKLEMLISYIAIATGLIAVILLHRTVAVLVTRPLNGIAQMTQAIANGDFDSPLKPGGNDEIGQLANSFASMRERLQQTSRQVEELAYFDTLTGLPNKVTSLDIMQQLIERSTQRGTQMAVLFFDLDNFKNINDALGHQLGDILLMQVGARLKECIRSHDLMQRNPLHPDPQDSQMLARMGGDEFTLVLSNLHSPDQAAKVAARILSKLAQPFKLDEHEVFISASIGVSVYPKDGTTPESLLKHADVAMYSAKAKGKNNYQFYDASMHKPMTERLALEASMRSALENNEFVLFYQPKVPVQGQQRIEFEALMRWKHPEKGMISPALFIPMAEDTGYIQQLGDWALETACLQLDIWNSKGYRNVSISVNLSPMQLNFGNPLQTLERCLHQFAIDPAQLELEITESSLMQNESHAIDILCKLKDLGVRIALDDFGTGYSSLAYLRRFPIDTLKIDRSFIRDLEQDPESVLVLESIIGLAQNLKLEIVAEGIETERQRDMLQERGCDFIQGFYYAKPCEPAESMQFFDRYFARQDLKVG